LVRLGGRHAAPWIQRTAKRSRARTRDPLRPALRSRHVAQIGPKQRKLVRPYARLITTCQLSQMGVGLAVNGLTIYYQSLGHKCYANKTNTILSWIMYASYFVLFGILYLKNYIFKKLSHSPKRKKAD